MSVKVIAKLTFGALVCLVLYDAGQAAITKLGEWRLAAQRKAEDELRAEALKTHTVSGLPLNFLMMYMRLKRDDRAGLERCITVAFEKSMRRILASSWPRSTACEAMKYIDFRENVERLQRMQEVLNAQSL